MTTGHRFLAAVMAAVAAVAFTVPQADALDAYWQGQFSTQWGHGVNGGMSNWYDQAPYNGNPVAVPNGTAFFSPAQLLNLAPAVLSHQSIRSIVFPEGGDKTFSINVTGLPDKASLAIKGDGIRNRSDRPQEFHVSHNAELKFKNKSTSGSLPGQSIDIFNNIGGKTKFLNKSKASFFTTIVNGDNSRLLFQDKSKCEYCTIINNGKSALVSFNERSQSINANLNNLNGKLEFTNSKNELYLFLDIANSAKILLGNNRISSKSTILGPGSAIVFSLPSLLKSATFDASGQLHLDGKAVIFGSSRWKSGDKHTLMKGKPLAGTFNKVIFAGFSKSVKPTLEYGPKRVIVRIKKKK